MWICYFPPELRQNCSCTDPMEASYYSSALIKFPSVSYCGMGTLINDVELKRKFGIVRPLCSVCKGQGRTHKVSHPNEQKAQNYLMAFFWHEINFMIFIYIFFFFLPTCLPHSTIQAARATTNQIGMALSLAASVNSLLTG